MRGSPKFWWPTYLACACALVIVLGGVSRVVFQLEAAELRALARAEQQATVSQALWRMDSWLAPLLAREAVRSHLEYRSFYEEPDLFTRAMNPIELGEVLKPSPLLTAQHDYVRLYFQFDDSGRLTSPQVPEGNYRDVAEFKCMPSNDVDANDAVLDELSDLIDAPRACEIVTGAEGAEDLELPPAPESQQEGMSTAQQVADDVWNTSGQVQSIDWSQAAQRIGRSYLARKAVDAEEALAQRRWLGPATEPRLGPLVPAWLSVEPSASHELVFVRRVSIGDETLYQGFLASWPRLRAGLLAQVATLVPGATLAPVLGAMPDLRTANLLGTVPAALDVDDVPPPTVPLFTPARVTLGVTWLAVCLALLLSGATLRASIAYGDRRSRFASAVTHELRTPLTTFQMYSEMLAEDMVSDPEERRSYLETLTRESRRLSGLVENVLAYSRLEDGRQTPRTASVLVRDLLSRVAPPLERRCEEVGLEFVLENRVGSKVESIPADVDAIQQILFNLVDNACKYAATPGGSVVLTAEPTAQGGLRLHVVDKGPGLTAAQRRVLFEPFERCGRDQADPTPGVGLGLALARDLARSLGGDLTVEAHAEVGASFTLALPGPPAPPRRSRG